MNICLSCKYYGCELDGDPFCTNTCVASTAEREFGTPFPYGVEISYARLLCKDKNFEQHPLRSTLTTKS